MKNKPFRNLIYFLLPIFCLFCASKNEEIETYENELIELQEHIDCLEYIVKNTATGGEFSSGQPSADISEKNAADNATSIQVLKAKINYLEKELQNMMTHPGTWDNPFSIYNKKILMDNGTLYYGNIRYYFNKKRSW